VIYQDPLAYLLGLEGIALLDAWAGDHDRAFTEARLAEVRRLLADEQLRDRGVQVEQVSAAAVYGQISVGYDADAGGGLFATDEPVVAEYLASRESGVALDAACGPGGSPSSWPGAGTASSVSTAHRTCSPTRGDVSPGPSFTSPSLTGCRCRMTPLTLSSARSRSSTSPASIR
jgi:hypothetical protein